MSTISSLFVTKVYRGEAEGPGEIALISEVERAAKSIARQDRAGRQWSKSHGYSGYTSYASLDDLPRRDPAFGDLVKILDKHVARFVAELDWELSSKLKLDSIWINVLAPGGTHSGHIHPHSAVSGTYYVSVPPGSSALKLEDPRLPLMMAAPMRKSDARTELRPFLYLEPKPGSIVLWESWLRHEVPVNEAAEDRISVSFNYRSSVR